MRFFNKNIAFLLAGIFGWVDESFCPVIELSAENPEALCGMLRRQKEGHVGAATTWLFDADGVLVDANGLKSGNGFSHIMGPVSEFVKELIADESGDHSVGVVTARDWFRTFCPYESARPGAELVNAFLAHNMRFNFLPDFGRGCGADGDFEPAVDCGHKGLTCCHGAVFAGAAFFRKLKGVVLDAFCRHCVEIGLGDPFERVRVVVFVDNRKKNVDSIGYFFSKHPNFGPGGEKTAVVIHLKDSVKSPAKPPECASWEGDKLPDVIAPEAVPLPRDGAVAGPPPEEP